MTPELRDRANRLRRRILHWDRHGWAARFGPLYGGPLDHGVAVGAILPHLAAMVRPIPWNGARAYVLTPSEVPPVTLHPSTAAKPLYWVSEGWPAVAGLGLLTLCAWCWDCDLATAAFDLRQMLADAIVATAGR